MFSSVINHNLRGSDLDLENVSLIQLLVSDGQNMQFKEYIIDKYVIEC